MWGVRPKNSMLHEHVATETCQDYVHGVESRGVGSRITMLKPWSMKLYGRMVILETPLQLTSDTLRPRI